MFKLQQQSGVYCYPTENAAVNSVEFILLSDGRKVSHDQGPFPTEWEEDKLAKVWTFEIEGRLEYASDRDEAVDAITEWLAEHPAKAAKLFAS